MIKPVVLYGIGDGADKVLELCEAKRIKVSGIFASDDFAKGQVFRGYKVKKLSEIEEEYKDFCILLAFGTKNPEVMERIYRLGEKYELYAPHFPLFGGGHFDADYIKGNMGAIEKAYSLLRDDASRKVYSGAIDFMVSGKLQYLKECESPKSEALDLLGLQSGLYYIDAGAYDGDTVLELNDYLGGKNIKRIDAFEPDRKNFGRLKAHMLESGLSQLCRLHNAAVWSGEQMLCFQAKSGKSSGVGQKQTPEKTPAHRLDDILDYALLEGESLIKYDVEGSEYEAIKGTRGIMAKYAPKLIVSLYHRTGDIFALPLLLHSINPDYDLYIRKHPSLPCWDLNLYAVGRKK